MMQKIKAKILMITPITVSPNFEQKAWKFIPSKVLFTWRYLVEEVNPNHKLEAEGLYAYKNYTKTSGLSIICGFNSHKFSECFIKSILIISTCPIILRFTPASLLIQLWCCHCLFWHPSRSNCAVQVLLGESFFIRAWSTYQGSDS